MADIFYQRRGPLEKLFSGFLTIFRSDRPEREPEFLKMLVYGHDLIGNGVVDEEPVLREPVQKLIGSFRRCDCLILNRRFARKMACAKSCYEGFVCPDESFEKLLQYLRPFLMQLRVASLMLKSYALQVVSQTLDFNSVPVFEFCLKSLKVAR